MHDAILSYSRHLADAINAGGTAYAAVSTLSRADGAHRRAGNGGGLEGFDAYLLQHNPFSFGRRGFAPWLPVAWQRLGARSGARMVVTIHEAFMPFVGLRSRAMGTWQAAQLWSLLRATDVVIATCRVRGDQLRLIGGARRLVHVPVSTNIDESVDEDARAALRDRLSGGSAKAIIATFGNNHPARLHTRVEATVRALAGSIGSHVVLNLGADAPALALPPGVDLVTPGSLSATDLALHLSCADLVLLPYREGAITGRTTLMASLALGRPVLSTRGPATDAILSDSPLRLIPVDDEAAYAAAAVALINDGAGRAELGRRGRELYDRAFSRRVIAAATLAAIGLPPGPTPAAGLTAVSAI